MAWTELCLWTSTLTVPYGGILVFPPFCVCPESSLWVVCVTLPVTLTFLSQVAQSSAPFGTEPKSSISFVTQISFLSA